MIVAYRDLKMIVDFLISTLNGILELVLGTILCCVIVYFVIELVIKFFKRIL